MSASECLKTDKYPRIFDHCVPDMDSVDLQIVSELDLNSRQSFAKVARALGLTRRTVQRRVRKMVDSGFIRSFEVLFDLSQLGLADAVCNVRVRSGSGVESVRERLVRVPGVTEVLTFVGGVLVAQIAYSDREELEDILRRIGTIEGVADIDYETGPKTSPSVPLTQSDWKLVRSLNHDARKEILEIADELSVSPKTVQRRLRFLEKKGALRFGLQVDVSSAEDLFPYLLLVRLQPGISKPKMYDRVRQLVPRVWRSMKTVNPFLLTLASHAVKLSDLERDAESLRMTPGVRGVSILFNSSDLSNNDLLDEAVHRASGPAHPSW